MSTLGECSFPVFGKHADYTQKYFLYPILIIFCSVSSSFLILLGFIKASCVQGARITPTASGSDSMFRPLGKVLGFLITKGKSFNLEYCWLSIPASRFSILSIKCSISDYIFVFQFHDFELCIH